METKSNKAKVAAVGALLLAVLPLLPADSTVSHTLGAVIAAGTAFGVWKVPNPPKAERRPPIRP